ncbi:MAG: SCO family protein [Magnetococcales bacterium]|nr:SCO family protein [Magnetococcales bacterium]
MFLAVGPKPLTPFQLIDHRGGSFGPEQFGGYWSLLFFGYTFCPDICPTVMGDLEGVFVEFEERRALDESLRAIFISVDPKRDDPERVGAYVDYFHPAFVGLTGDPKEIQALATQVGAVYFIRPGQEEEDYLVSHTASVFLIDPKGRFVGIFPAPHEPRKLAERFIQIRKQHEGETP